MGRYGGGDATISTPMGEIKIDASKDRGMKDLPAQATISTPAGNAVITTTPATPGTPGAPADSASMTIKTPEGEVKIDVQKMEAFAKQMEAMAAQMEKNKK